MNIVLDKLLFGGFIDQHRNELAQQQLNRLFAKYGEPKIGITRACFLSKHYVLKFPINDRGERCNDWEGSCSGSYLARGRWLEIGGFICVMQERLVEVDWKNNTYANFPDWVGSIDCGQVGYDKHGVLKAYDFG